MFKKLLSSVPFQFFALGAVCLVLGFALRSWMDSNELSDLRAKAGTVARDYAQSQKLVTGLNAQIDGLQKSNRDLADQLAKNPGRVITIQGGVTSAINSGRVIGSTIDGAQIDSSGLTGLLGQLQSGLSDLQNIGGK